MSIAILVLAGGCASGAISEGARPSHAAQAPIDAVLEGSLEVIIEDSREGSRTLYFLIVGDDRITLRFSVDPPGFTTGERARVRGRWDTDGTFVVHAIERAS